METFTVTAPKGREFQICENCRHWVKRLLVNCKCCTERHPRGESNG